MRTLRTNTRYGEILVPATDICVGRSLVEYGEWTQSEVDLLLQIVRPGMTVLDVGANVGYHTLALSKAVGPSGVVVSFEPQPAIFQLLAANIANNNLGNVTALNAAVGEKRGLVDMPPFSYDDTQNFGALDIRSFLKGETETTAYIPIAMQRLDDISLARNAQLIKLDVEGMELAALRGATEILARCRPALFVENHSAGESSEQLLQFLDQHG
ncbi:MAG: FkbM family methyltransferase [Mesorhizobium sp.]